MQKTLIALFSLSIILASTAVILAAEDTDGDVASIDLIERVYDENGIRYDLCEQADSATYGHQYIAFVTGGSRTDINTNCKLTGPIIEIKSKIKADIKTSETETEEIEFTVVGIRNNAFQASLHPERYTESIEKVIIPETLVTIGAGLEYMMDTTGAYCFSGCHDMLELVVEGTEPKLKNIGPGAFKDAGKTNGLIIDLSHCKNLDTVKWNAFENANISLLDLSHVGSIGNNAFRGSSIQSFIMPVDADARIDPGAFRDAGDNILDIWDVDGNKIEDNKNLIGKALKYDKNDGDKLKEGFVATFDTKGGKTVPRGVYFVDEALPIPEKAGHIFLRWTYVDSGETKETDTMLGKHTDFTVEWQIGDMGLEVPYNGEIQRPYGNEHDDYTVTGDIEKKEVGSYRVDITPTGVTVWYDTHTQETRQFTWKIVPKEIDIEGITAEDKEYDGTADAEIDISGVDLESAGVITDELSQVGITVTGAFEDRNAGTDKTVNLTVTLTGECAKNYKLSAASQKTAKATIDHKDATAFFPTNYTKVYGDADPMFIPRVIGLLGSDTIDLSYERALGENVGHHAISFTGGAIQGNYEVTYEHGNLEITHRHADVIAESKWKFLGEADPELTVRFRNLVEGDSIAYSISRDSGEAIGIYDISVTAAETQGNYKVFAHDGTFAIIAAGSVVVMADSKTKEYGDSDPALSATVGGDPPGTIDYTLSRESGEDVGHYVITVTGEATQHGVSVTFIDGRLDIEHRDVFVIADNKTKEYGRDDPELTVRFKNLVGEDTISYTLSREHGEDIGEYIISVTGATIQGNYEVVFENGIFDITHRTATVRGDDKSKTYGDSDPVMTATVDGLLPGDTVRYQISRVSGESVGEYNVIPSGDTIQGNYRVLYHHGAFTIHPKHVIVRADDKSKEYGDEVELTATVIGIKRGDSIQYTLTCESEEVGVHRIIASGEANQGNYIITSFMDGTMTISKKHVTVRADDKVKGFGEPDPEFTETVTGVHGNDIIIHTIYREPGEDVGRYAIIVGGETEQGNYIVSFENGTLTIAGDVVTVIADDKYKVHGESDPPLTATVESQTAVPIEYTLSREPGEEVGTYVITVTGPEHQGDVHVVFINGTFTITVGETYTVTVVISGEGAASASPAVCSAGAPVALTQSAADGWYFKEWSSSQVTIEGDSFVMPAGNVTVTAVFAEHSHGGDDDTIDWMWLLLLILALIVVSLIAYYISRKERGYRPNPTGAPPGPLEPFPNSSREPNFPMSASRDSLGTGPSWRGEIEPAHIQEY